MKQVYFLLLASSFLLSCGVRINYLGNTLSPTSKVDVYVDASAIRRPYTIMGKGYADYLMHTAVRSTDKLQQKALELARKKGADAVLFQDYVLQRDGTQFYTLSKTDSIGRGVITTTSGTLTPQVSTGQTIFFLKYN